MFEAGLFGGVLGMRRTFILHASGAKLPTDLLGLTCVRYAGAMTPAETKTINQKIRKAIESEGHLAHRGFLVAVLADRAQRQGAVGAEPPENLARAERRAGARRPRVARGRQPVGALLVRGGAGEGRRVRHLLLLEGRAAARPERAAARRDRRDPADSADRASGYFTTRSDRDPELYARTSGVYWRADPDDASILDGRDDQKRAALIAERLTQWKSVRSA